MWKTRSGVALQLMTRWFSFTVSCSKLLLLQVEPQGPILVLNLLHLVQYKRLRIFMG